MNSHLKREKLSEQVTARLKLLIAEKGLVPGDRLPTEQEMADEFGVSRASVREATQALAFLGIIDAAPRRGLTVGKVDLERASQFLGFHFAISDYPRHMLVSARIVIETGALPYAMEALAKNPALYDEMSAIVDHMEAVDTDVEGYIADDIAFHRALVQSSGIEPLLAFSDLLNAFFARFREDVKSGYEFGKHMHRELLEALRLRQLERARHILYEHMGAYPDSELTSEKKQEK
jgi:GntR family transcriptional regulator, transcriptional repressor for pyruvate dehydrogenase complex